MWRIRRDYEKNGHFCCKTLCYFGIQLRVLKKATKFLSQAVDYAVDILIGQTRHLLANPARFMRSALKLLSWNQGYEICSSERTSSLFKLLLHWPKSVVESSRACLAKLQSFWKELMYERGALHESTWGASNKAGSLYLQHAGKPRYIRLDWSHLTANWLTSPNRTRRMHTVNVT